MLIKRGNKAKIEAGFLVVLRDLKKKKRKYSITEYLRRATNQARPFLTLVSKKRGSVSYRIPMYISIKREVFQAIYWIINETCGLKKGNYKKVLVKEFVNLSFITGNALRAKRKLHRTAQQNRVFIKYLS